MRNTDTNTNTDRNRYTNTDRNRYTNTNRNTDRNRYTSTDRNTDRNMDRNTDKAKKFNIVPLRNTTRLVPNTNSSIGWNVLVKKSREQNKQD